MKPFVDIDYNHALGVGVTVAASATANLAVFAPAPPSLEDVLFGFLGGLLGATIMVIAMPSLRPDREDGRRFSGPFFLIVISAAWAGLASAFTAAVILYRLDLIAMSGPVATALGGSVAAMGALAVFPLLIKIIGWTGRNVDQIAEALFAWVKRLLGLER